jgi:hypothetical protein
LRFYQNPVRFKVKNATMQGLTPSENATMRGLTPSEKAIMQGLTPSDDPI